MVGIPKKRGRPRKKPIPGTEPGATEIAVTGEETRTDDEILYEVLERFNGLRELAKGIGSQKVRGLIVSGAPGIGKTYTIEGILKHMESEGMTRIKIVRGYMSAVELYRLLWEYRHPKDCIIVDDCDAIFYNDDALNIMKAALDTIEIRTISYRVNNRAEMNDDGDVSSNGEEGEAPNEFEYKGSMVFTTNIDFDAFLKASERNQNRMAPHIEALQNRCLYLDMKLHASRAVVLWINYMMTQQKMLQAPQYGMTEAQSTEILKYMMDNSVRIPRMSLRTAVKIVELIKLSPDNWKMLANVTLARK